MSIYKTKETALRHIKNGAKFTKTAFQLFWSNGDVYTEALEHDPTCLGFVLAKNPDIQWDENFTVKHFKCLLEMRNSLYSFSMDDIFPYLPPEITESKEIALQAKEFHGFDSPSYFAPDLASDIEVYAAYYSEYEIEEKPIHPSLARLLLDERKIFAFLITEFPRVYWYLPHELQRTREACVSICAHEKDFRFAYGGLHDDEEFVLDVLKLCKERGKECIFYAASYRIRKACGENNPMDYLESFTAAKKLEASLQRKSPIEQQRTSSKKI